MKTIAIAAVLAATAGVAGAQATTVAKSAVQTAAKKTSSQPRTPRKTDSQAALRAEAKISPAAARAIALKEVPNGKVKSSELERENGNVIYSFDIRVAGKSGIEEVNVNAVDGSIVAHEHESPKAEKKEAAAEAKAKTSKK